MKIRIKKPLFITFEGIEGSGKSTQIKKAADFLKKIGIKHIVTREPGGTELGNKLRELVLVPTKKPLDATTELLIMLASRADHVAKVIGKNLAMGKTVLCDRFSDATFAYQGGGRGLDIGTIAELNDFATGGLKPDLTFLFDLPAEAGLERAMERLSKITRAKRESRFENEAIKFHKRVRSTYLNIAMAEPQRVKVLNARKGIEQIAKEVQRILLDELS